MRSRNVRVTDETTSNGGLEAGPDQPRRPFQAWNRRQFLHGAGGLAAGAVVGGGFLSRAASRPAASTSEHVTGRLETALPGLIGCTAIPEGYGLSDYLQAAQQVDGILGGRPLALTIQKWYLKEGEYYLSESDIPNGLLELCDRGCEIFLSIKPPPKYTAADYRSVTTTLNVVGAKAKRLYCTLWQEPNNPGNFPSAQAYKDLVASFIGAVREAGVPHAYDPTVYSAGTYIDFYPGDANVDLVVCDYYGTSYKHGSRLDVPPAGYAQSIMDLADDHRPSPVPFGIGEWGDSSTGHVITPAMWDDYWKHVQSVFVTRRQQGKSNAFLIWYSGVTRHGPNILPNGPGYSLVHGIEAVYDSLTGSS